MKGTAVKLKPPKKKRPANRKKIYTDDVIAALRLVWAFFRYKCGKLPVPLMRRQMDYIVRWPAFGISPAVRDKLMRISPAAIDRVLRKDKSALALKGKSLTQFADILKHRILIRTFYTSPERKLPGFVQIDTVHHCGQGSNRKTAPLSGSISAITALKGMSFRPALPPPGIAPQLLHVRDED